MAARWSLRRLFARDEGRELLSAEATTSAEITEVGDFRIDAAARTVTLRGERLNLTSEEFDVLVFVTTHQQRCVTPRTVLATNWTGDGLHQTDFLRTLLSLRKKLDAVAAGKQYLRTEPWVIYRFNPRCTIPA
jgi:two-component system, OmpR family, KDP operon response regulator KdpE